MMADFRNHLHKAELRERYLKGARLQWRLRLQELRDWPFMNQLYGNSRPVLAQRTKHEIRAAPNSQPAELGLRVR
jgi:hypothetical protein